MQNTKVLAVNRLRDKGIRYQDVGPFFHDNSLELRRALIIWEARYDPEAARTYVIDRLGDGDMFDAPEILGEIGASADDLRKVSEFMGEQTRQKNVPLRF